MSTTNTNNTVSRFKIFGSGRNKPEVKMERVCRLPKDANSPIATKRRGSDWVDVLELDAEVQLTPVDVLPDEWWVTEFDELMYGINEDVSLIEIVDADNQAIIPLGEYIKDLLYLHDEDVAAAKDGYSLGKLRITIERVEGED